MSQVDIILARCDIGQQIIDKMMTMKDDEIKDFLHTVVTTKNIHDLVWDGSVTRIIQDETIQKIELSYFDSIEVNAQGIYYKPEHRNGEYLLLFNDNFITKSILSELGLE